MRPARPAPTTRPDYGIDAPGVVRNLLVIGGIFLLTSLLVVLRQLPDRLVTPPVGGMQLEFQLLPTGLGPGLAMTAMGLFMLWSSRVGKVRRRERLLNRLAWRGDEQVLDVGCGRGLFLVGAARRLVGGRATGIDIWRAEDLSNNSAEATLANARLEGVAERVEVRTADMRELPFPDATFDVVLSCAAIHNLDAEQDRAAAIRQVARVLKPGGHALIDDVRHVEAYAATFAAAGCPTVRRLDNRLEGLFWTLVTFGSLRPGTLLVRKGG